MVLCNRGNGLFVLLCRCDGVFYFDLSLSASPLGPCTPHNWHTIQPPSYTYVLNARAAYLSWKIAYIFVCIIMSYVCGNTLIWAMNFPFTYRYVCGSCAVMYVNLRVYTTLTAIHFSLFMSSFQLCIFWWLYWESEEEFSRQLLVTSHYWCQHRRYLYHRWWKGGLLTHSPILVGNIFRRSMRWIFSPNHCLLEDSTHNSVT